MKNKKKIIGLSVAAVIAFGSQVEVSPSPITPNEWQAYVSMINYEIDQSGGNIKVNNFKTFKDLNNVVRTRIPNESVIINNSTTTPQQYMNIRENLLKKTEPQKLINKIISI